MQSSNKTPQSDHPRLLRRPEVEHITGLSRSSIYLQIQSGDFPAPVKIGARAVAWHAKTIYDWMDAREEV